MSADTVSSSDRLAAASVYVLAVEGAEPDVLAREAAGRRSVLHHAAQMAQRLSGLVTRNLDVLERLDAASRLIR